MKTKILYYISTLVAIVFIAAIIALNIAEIINLGSMIALVFLVVIITIGALVARWYFSTRKASLPVPEKAITIEQAREMAKKELMNTQYSEYEKELHYEDTWDMGESHDPVYVRLSTGVFDKRYLSVLINLADPTKISTKSYPSTENQEKIEADISKRANLLAKAPKPETKYKVIQSLEPSSGRIVSEQTPLEQKEDGGELK